MKNLRACVSFLLLAAILLAGCSGSAQSEESVPKETSPAPTAADAPTAEETEDPYEKDNLPNDLNFGGQSLRIGMYTSVGQQAAVAPEEETGDLLNDAVFQRNVRVMDRLNVKIETNPHTCGWAEYRALVLDTITAGTGDFDAWYLWQYDFANTVAENYWLDLRDAPYIDYSKPWWATDYIEEMSVDGKAKYFLLGDISYGFMNNSDCVFFNKNLVEQYGISADSVYQTVLEGKWTLDSLKETAGKIYTDTNGNGVVDVGDKVAFGYCGGNWAQPEHFVFDAGNRFSYRGEDGYPVLDPITEKMVNTIDIIIDLFHNTPTVILYGDSDASSDVVQLWRDDFAAGNSAFHFETISRMTAWREMDNDYGVIPFPKYDEAQETYLSLVHDTAYMYGVPSDCRDIDAVCALMEALAADSHRNVMPVYYDQVLKGKYARDTVSGQILDIIHDHPVADFAYINGYGFNTNIRYICNSTGTNTYVSETKRTVILKEKELKKLIKAVEARG